MYLWITFKKIFYEIAILRYYHNLNKLLIYNLKLKLFILITLVDFAELLTDFSYTNFTVGLSNVDASDRLRVHLNVILFQ